MASGPRPAVAEWGRRTDPNRVTRGAARDRLHADRREPARPRRRPRLRRGRDPAPHPRVGREGRGSPRGLRARWPSSGFLGAPIPEAYGGAGMDYISFALLCEELERADTAFRVVQSVHVGLNSLALLQWGTEEQRQRWLVPQARGEKLATFGLTEPGVGTDAGQPRDDRPPRWRRLPPQRPEDLDQPRGHRRPLPRLRDRRQGEEAQGRDGVHRRAGMHGTDTGHAPRQARDPGRQHRADQPRRRAGAGREPDRRGGRGLPHRDERDRPGPLHGGRGRGRARPGLPRRERPVRPRAADVRRGDRPPPARQADDRQDGAGTEIGRLLVWRPAGSRTRACGTPARRASRSGTRPSTRSRRALDAIQIHGANGYSNEFPVERYLRNSKAAVIYEGTSQLHTLIQADYALGYREDRPLRCEPWPAQGWERGTPRA